MMVLQIEHPEEFTMPDQRYSQGEKQFLMASYACVFLYHDQYRLDDVKKMTLEQTCMHRAYEFDRIQTLNYHLEENLFERCPEEEM